MLLYLSFQIFSNFLLSHIGGRKIFSDSGQNRLKKYIACKFCFWCNFYFSLLQDVAGRTEQKGRKKILLDKRNLWGEISFTNKKINKVRKREAGKAEKCVNESYLEIF